MPFLPTRWMSDVLEIAGAVGTGAGLQYLRQNVESFKDKSGMPADNALIAGLGIAGIGVIGSSQLSGDVASLMEGIAMGALGVTGAMLYQKIKPMSAQVPTSYYTPYYIPTVPVNSLSQPLASAGVEV